MDTATDPRASIGHNNPPDPIELLRNHLRETHTELMERAAALLGLADRLPEPDEMSDEWAEKIAEAVKSCTKFTRNCEVTRMAANEPHRALIGATDAFFKQMSEAVDILKTRMAHQYLTPWQKQKAAEEQQRRDEAAAEAKRIADEERNRLQAEAAALAELKRREREASDGAEAERLAVERLEQERLAAEARQRALLAEQKRNVTARAAGASAAEMSRTRTDLGAMASLRTTYGFDIVAPERIPRTYLSVNTPAINAAIRAATRDGVCDLKIPGVVIYPITNTVVR